MGDLRERLASLISLDPPEDPLEDAGAVSRYIATSTDASKRVLSHYVKLADGGFESRYAADAHALDAVRNAGPLLLVCSTAVAGSPTPGDLAVDGKKYALEWSAQAGGDVTASMYRRDTEASWLFPEGVPAQDVVKSVVRKVRQVVVTLEEGGAIAMGVNERAALAVTSSSDLVLPYYLDPDTGARMALYDPDNGQALFTAADLKARLGRPLRPDDRPTGPPLYL